MKLLAVRLDSTGDVLMCSPALRALHEHGHTVTLLTSTAGALAGERIDGVADVIRWAAPWMKASAAASAACLPAMVAQLCQRGFDGAVIFTSYSQSPLPAAMLCQMAGIPLRLAHCRENPYQLLTHWVRESEPEQQLRHEVERQIDLVAQLGCRPASVRLSVRIDATDRAAARGALRDAGIDPESDWLLLHPGASAPARRYPAARWRNAAALLAGHAGLPLLFAGGRDDVELVREIVLGDAIGLEHDTTGVAGSDSISGANGGSADGAMNGVVRNRAAHHQHERAQRWPSLAGQLDFGALAALVSMARVLVACNSAPAHLAAATGTPVVDLYALTNPQHTPWQVMHRLLYRSVPCHGCYQSICPHGHQRCLSAVEPREVLQAVRQLLQSTSG